MRYPCPICNEDVDACEHMPSVQRDALHALMVRVLDAVENGGPETGCLERADGTHCEHWYDGSACCACGAGKEVLDIFAEAEHSRTEEADTLPWSELDVTSVPARIGKSTARPVVGIVVDLPGAPDRLDDSPGRGTAKAVSKYAEKYGSIDGYRPQSFEEIDLASLRTGFSPCNPAAAMLLVQRIDALNHFADHVSRDDNYTRADARAAARGELCGVCEREREQEECERE